MLEVVTGAPFAGTGRWVEAQIAKREAAGERGLVRIGYSELYTAIVPGVESSYRDAEVSDTGAPRLTAWLYAAAIREAADRELSGYIQTDSPRRATRILQEIGGDRSIIEVTVSKAAAISRSQEHLDGLSELAPRAAASDRLAADEKCRKGIETFFSERPVLEGYDVRSVTAPNRPSDRQITYAWEVAIRAAKRKDFGKRDKWTGRARAMLKTRGIKA